jgi:LPS-assembly protein
VKLTGFRQQIFNTLFYYESASSAGYYRQFFAATNNNLFSATNRPPAYSAARADTFHQLLLPWTFFNWLNVTPHAGGRFTWYSRESGPGGTNDETDRAVFNTGVETSFKVSQLWAGATNSLLDIDGLRHIIEPSVNYVFVPRPTTPLSQLPQFDSASPSLLLLPIQFPDYDNIDSIDSQNVIRFGLRNALQTKRDGQLQRSLLRPHVQAALVDRAWFTTALRHQRRRFEPGLSSTHVDPQRKMELGRRPLVFAQRI